MLAVSYLVEKTTRDSWSWDADRFVVLVKEPSSNIPTPVDPYSAKVGDFVEWENPIGLFGGRFQNITSMTEGMLYEVRDVTQNCLETITNDQRADIWMKDRFKRIFTNEGATPLIGTIVITKTQARQKQNTYERQVVDQYIY